MPKRMKDELLAIFAFFLTLLFLGILLGTAIIYDNGTKYTTVCQIIMVLSGLVMTFPFALMIAMIANLDINSDGIEDFIFKRFMNGKDNNNS